MTHDEIKKAISDRIRTIDMEIAKLQAERGKLAAMGSPAPAHAPERFVPVYVPPPHFPPVYPEPWRPSLPLDVTFAIDVGDAIQTHVLGMFERVALTSGVS